MKTNKITNWIPLLLLAIPLCVTAQAKTQRANGKLKIFILSGQSNMVGHANPHTIATLYQSDDPRDKELIKLVFASDGPISKTKLEEQLRLAVKIDELTGGISNDKIKNMRDRKSVV